MWISRSRLGDCLMLWIIRFHWLIPPYLLFHLSNCISKLNLSWEQVLLFPLFCWLHKSRPNLPWTSYFGSSDLDLSFGLNLPEWAHLQHTCAPPNHRLYPFSLAISPSLKRTWINNAHTISTGGFPIPLATFTLPPVPEYELFDPSVWALNRFPIHN